MARFEERLHAETEAWAREGLVTAEQAERIRARHPLGEPEASPVSHLLYAAAGILVGAASIALVAVTLDLEAAQLPLALLALGLLAVGVALRRTGIRPPLADALLVASLPPGVACGFGEAEAFSLLGVLLPAGLLAWRRDGFVPALCVIAFSVGAPSASFQLSELAVPPERSEDFAVPAWTALQALLVVALVARDRLATARDDAVSVALAAATLAIPLVWLLNDRTSLSSEGVELALGAVMLALALAGAWLKHRGLVLGAAVALAVDAIVFGFDVGGLLTGTLTLLAVAGVLVWQAELVKRYVRG